VHSPSHHRIPIEIQLSCPPTGPARITWKSFHQTSREKGSLPPRCKTPWTGIDIEPSPEALPFAIRHQVPLPSLVSHDVGLFNKKHPHCAFMRKPWTGGPIPRTGPWAVPQGGSCVNTFRAQLLEVFHSQYHRRCSLGFLRSVSLLQGHRECGGWIGRGSKSGST